MTSVGDMSCVDKKCTLIRAWIRFDSYKENRFEFLEVVVQVIMSVFRAQALNTVAFFKYLIEILQV